MTDNEFTRRYERLVYQAEKRLNDPIPEQCSTCTKNCPRSAYPAGGCHAFTVRPADEGKCWGWSDDPQWEAKADAALIRIYGLKGKRAIRARKRAQAARKGRPCTGSCNS